MEPIESNNCTRVTNRCKSDPDNRELKFYGGSTNHEKNLALQENLTCSRNNGILFCVRFKFFQSKFNRKKFRLFQCFCSKTMQQFSLERSINVLIFVLQLTNRNTGIALEVSHLISHVTFMKSREFGITFDLHRAIHSNTFPFCVNLCLQFVFVAKQDQTFEHAFFFMGSTLSILYLLVDEKEERLSC